MTNLCKLHTFILMKLGKFSKNKEHAATVVDIKVSRRMLNGELLIYLVCKMLPKCL